MKDPEFQFRWHLHKFLTGPEKARSHKTVHASELMAERRAFCPRELALMDETGTERRAEWLPAAQNFVYRASTVYQSLITQWAARMGIAVGDWRCRECSTLHILRKRPKVCKGCGRKKFSYVETRWTSKFSGVSGGVDLIVDLGEDEGYRVIEIKALQTSDFKALKAAKAEHRWRTNLYLRLVAESGLKRAEKINTQEATVLYVVKGGYGIKFPEAVSWGFGDIAFSPFLEFYVDRNDEHTQEKSERARALLLYRRKKAPVPAGICQAPLEPRAKNCPVSRECFSGKYPWPA